nr:hypothetical protein [Endozoicomonas sp.]
MHNERPDPGFCDPGFSMKDLTPVFRFRTMKDLTPVFLKDLTPVFSHRFSHEV